MFLERRKKKRPKKETIIKTLYQLISNGLSEIKEAKTKVERYSSLKRCFKNIIAYIDDMSKLKGCDSLTFLRDLKGDLSKFEEQIFKKIGELEKRYGSVRNIPETEWATLLEKHKSKILEMLKDMKDSLKEKLKA